VKKKNRIIQTALVSGFVFMSMFAMLIYLHEDEHGEVCSYFGGNASEITITSDGKIGIYCTDVPKDNQMIHWLAQSNIEANEITIFPFAFICTMLSMVAMQR